MMKTVNDSPTYVPTSSYIIQSSLGGDVEMVNWVVVEARVCWFELMCAFVRSVDLDPSRIRSWLGGLALIHSWLNDPARIHSWLDWFRYSYREHRWLALALLAASPRTIADSTFESSVNNRHAVPSPPVRCFHWAKTWWDSNDCWLASAWWNDWFQSPRVMTFVVPSSLN